MDRQTDTSLLQRRVIAYMLSRVKSNHILDISTVVGADSVSLCVKPCGRQLLLSA